MALAVTAVKNETADRIQIIKGTIVASGSYTGGGDTLDLTPLAPQIGIGRVPFLVVIQSAAGYQYTYVPGATLAAGKMQVWCNTAGGANLGLGEHTTAAYNAAVIADVIKVTVFISSRM
jgi:hypothetical protein